MSFTASCYRRLGLSATARVDGGQSSTPPAEISRKHSLVSRRIDAINLTAPESVFGLRTAEKLIGSLARLVRKIGAKKLEGPELCRGYSRGYYACFFEDLDSNKLEICCPRESDRW
jgi:hypothetical protein